MAFERNPRFYGELKQTNEDILKVVEGCQKKSPYFDFSAAFEDYIKQVQELKQKFPIEDAQDDTKPVTTSANSFTGNLFGNNTVNSSMNNGNNNSNDTSNNTTITNSIFASLASGQTTPFFVPKKNDEQEAMGGGEEQEEDSAPPQPNVEKFEEPDAKYTARCKLYERLLGAPNVSSSHSLLGCGSLFVKQLDAPNKLHLIIRQDPDLRKVLLNHVITAATPLRQLVKAIQLMVPGEDGKTTCYVIKVKDDKIASELYQLLHSVKEAQM
jgi:hypothetical protein